MRPAKPQQRPASGLKPLPRRLGCLTVHPARRGLVLMDWHFHDGDLCVGPPGVVTDLFRQSLFDFLDDGDPRRGWTIGVLCWWIGRVICRTADAPAVEAICRHWLRAICLWPGADYSHWGINPQDAAPPKPDRRLLPVTPHSARDQDLLSELRRRDALIYFAAVELADRRLMAAMLEVQDHRAVDLRRFLPMPKRY